MKLIKKYFRKNELMASGIGAIIGFCFSMFIFIMINLNPSFGTSSETFMNIVGVPILSGSFLTSIILAPICAISDPYTVTSWCAGLGFDSGPAQWFEFLMIHLSFAFYTGLIFFLVMKLYNFIGHRGK